MERSALKKKKKLSAADKVALLAKYEQAMKDSGGLANSIEQARATNAELEELVKKNPRRLMGGCG
jgi:hypothetical protein